VERIHGTRYRLGIEKIYILVILIPISLFSVSLEKTGIAHLDCSPLRGTYSEGYITLVDSLSRKVVLVDVDKKQVVLTLEDFLYPVWALFHANKIYVTDLFTGEFLEFDLLGRKRRSIYLGNDPSVFVYSRGKFYISLFSNGTLIALDERNFRIVERYRIGIPSSYFYIKDDEIIYMCYWRKRNDPAVVRIKGRQMKKIYLDLERPLRYIEGATGEYFLDYKNGKLVKLVRGEVVWNVNLPDLSYSLSFFGKDLAISSLVEPVVSVVDRNGKVKKLKVPHPVLDLEEIEEHLVAISNSENEVYLLSDRGVILREKTGKYPLKIFKLGKKEFAILCSDSQELLFYRIK